MALNSGKILMRRGQEANFDPNKMMPGEWAVSLDSKFVRMCFSPGVCIRMATYEAFEADMEQIQEILAECESIEQAVSLINTEVSQNAEAVIEYTKEAKQYRDEAKQYRDEAFSTTPDGYNSLVGQVNKNTVAINTIVEKAELNIKEAASGENIHLNDSADSKLVEFALYGKAVQNGTPTPEAPIDIEVAGSSGSVTIKSCGKNLLKNTATAITQNGVTYTINKDGSVIVNGTATANTALTVNKRLSLEEGKQYIASCVGSYEYKPNSELWWFIYDEEEEKDLANVSIPSFTYNGNNCLFRIFVRQNAVINNLVLYPMIRLASDTDDTYQPYKETVSTIPTTDFAGIKVSSNGNYTDSNGQQWIANEIVKYADGSGEKIQRIGKEIFDGSEDEAWYIDAQGRWVSKSLVEAGKTLSADELSNALCDRYQVKTGAQTYERNEGISVSNVTVIIYESNYSASDKATWTSYLAENPTTLYYELAEPISIPLTAEEISEIEKLSTFYPTTNISNDSDCGMKVKYIVDSKNYIDNQLAIQAKLQEEALLNMLLLMPEEVQASMIENDTNNLLNESGV